MPPTVRQFFDADRQRRIERTEQQIAPAIADLERAGFRHNPSTPLHYQKKQLSTEMIGVLMHWIPLVTDNAAKLTLIMTVAVPKAAPLAAQLLIEEFKAAAAPITKWQIGDALSAVADCSVLDPILQLIRHEAHCRARQILVLGLGRLNDPRAKAHLSRLCCHPELMGHAVAGLAILADPALVTCLFHSWTTRSHG